MTTGAHPGLPEVLGEQPIKLSAAYAGGRGLPPKRSAKGRGTAAVALGANATIAVEIG